MNDKPTFTIMEGEPKTFTILELEKNIENTKNKKIMNSIIAGIFLLSAFVARSISIEMGGYEELDMLIQTQSKLQLLYSCRRVVKVFCQKNTLQR